MFESRNAGMCVLGMVGAAALFVIPSSNANAAGSCKPGLQAFLAGNWAGTGTAGGPTNKLSFKFSATAAGTVQGTWVIKANTGQTISGTVTGDNLKGIKTQDKTGKYSYKMQPLTGCGTATVTGKLINGSPGALTPVIWSAQKA